jgi:hypothetical protein
MYIMSSYGARCTMGEAVLIRTLAKNTAKTVLPPKYCILGEEYKNNFI